MKHSLARSLPAGIAMAALAIACPLRTQQAPIAAHHVEGTLHGYLVMRSASGQVLAAGDLIQMVRGSRVTAQLVFHFKDGSIDDETTIFSQRGVFHLISDHHVQKGPFFPHPLDMWINDRKSEVKIRSNGKDGKGEVKTYRMKLPPNLCSPSMIATIAMNLTPAAGGQVSMVVATPKPRLVKLAFSGKGESRFSVAGFERQALHYEAKFDLQGVAGVVAPLLGKQPPDLGIWIAPGKVPVFVKEESVLAEGGPVVSIQQIGPLGPNYPGAASAK